MAGIRKGAGGRSHPRVNEGSEAVAPAAKSLPGGNLQLARPAVAKLDGFGKQGSCSAAWQADALLGLTCVRTAHRSSALQIRNIAYNEIGGDYGKHRRVR